MKKFLIDTLFITAGGFVNRVKGLLFIPVIIGALGMDAYGAFIQIFVTIKLAKAFSSMDLGQGFQRFASVFEKSERRQLGTHFYTIMLASVVMGSLGVLLHLVLSPWMSGLFFEGKFVEVIQLASVIMLSETLYSNANKFYLARKQFKLYSLINLLYDLVPYLMFVLGIVLHRSLYMGILFYAVTDMAVALLTVGLAARMVTVAAPSRELLGTYFTYSGPLMLSEVEGGLLDKVDRYFISAIMGLEALGIYNIIYRICSLLDFVTTPIRKQMMSYLPKAWDQGYQTESVTAIRHSLLLFLLITFGMLGAMTAYFTEILTYLTGDQVTVEYLYLNVVLLGLGILASGAKRFYYILVKLKGTTMDQLWYQLAGLIPNIVLNWLLIPHIGILGASISTFVSYILILLVINYRYDLGIDLSFWGHVVSFSLMAGVMYLIRTWVVVPDGVMLLLVSLGLSTLVYIGLIVATKRKFLLGMRQSLEAFRLIKKQAETTA
ncbi:MAG: oligosaccharide flippase family protein [Bacteroidia bacterium]|nr:oligosaccharide flippase family protein [Bacteroidia bacterium]